MPNTHDTPNAADDPTVDPTIPARRKAKMIPALAGGMGTTIAVWIAWWLTHLPTLATPSALAASIIAIVFVVSLVLWARLSPTPVRTGLVGGAFAGVLNLLILGSVLSVQAGDASQMSVYANRFRDDAGVILVAYTSLTMALGLGCGALARLVRVRQPSTDPGRWLGRLGVVTVVAFFPLLMVGGAVTSTESGMAVPDAITSYGAFSALLPMSMMAEPRIFFEHTHRLLGTLVGLAAIALLAATIAIEKRRAPKIFAGVLLALVTAQGLLGAARVGANSALLAGFHGVLAQLVVAFAVIVACRLAPLDRDPPASVDARTSAAAVRGKKLTHTAAGLLLIQLVLGALARHSGSSHAVWTHAGFAVVVTAFILIAAAALHGADGASQPGRLLRRIGLVLTVTVFCQFLLGFASLWQVGLSAADRPVPTSATLAEAPAIDAAEAVVTTAHQTVGAALFVFATLGVFWSKRTARIPTAPA